MVFDNDFIIYFSVSQIHTQQLMRSRIRLHIEYIIQTYCILVLIS